MPVNPTLRLVIEFTDSDAEARFEKFYQRQDLKLDLGNCEIFTARLVAIAEAPREIDFVDECTTIDEMATALSERYRSVYHGLSSSNIGEYLNILPSWTVVIRNVDTGILDTYNIAKCLPATFLNVLQSRGYKLDELALSAIHRNTLHFLHGTEIETRCKAKGIKPLNLDLIFDKWQTT